MFFIYLMSARGSLCLLNYIGLLSCVIVIFALYSSQVSANEPQPRILGAATCGSASCHDAPEPWMNSAVRQNEFAVWRDDDPHSTAWETLESETSNKIARQLGIDDPTTSPKCLGCHATKVGSGGHDVGFDIRNGITCEACHGPASEWLGVHSSGLYFYEKNMEYGLYPTGNPQKRAELCVACHVGSDDGFVTHEMMALGHPPLAFQLNYHTWFKPDAYGTVASYAHIQLDDDYLQRKPRPFGLKALLVGEIVQWRQFLQLQQSAYFDTIGLFPELAFFDCYSCHFPTDTDGGAVGEVTAFRRIATSSDALDAQYVPPLADHNFFIVDLAAEGVVDNKLRDQLRQARNRMQAAAIFSNGDLKTQSAIIVDQLNYLLSELEAYEFSLADELGMLNRVSAEVRRGKLNNHSAAKQALYATASLIDSLHRRGEIPTDRYLAARTAINEGLVTGVSGSKSGLSVQSAILESVSVLEISDNNQKGEAK